MVIIIIFTGNNTISLVLANYSRFEKYNVVVIMDGYNSVSQPPVRIDLKTFLPGLDLF